MSNKQQQRMIAASLLAVIGCTGSDSDSTPDTAVTQKGRSGVQVARFHAERRARSRDQYLHRVERVLGVLAGVSVERQELEATLGDEALEGDAPVWRAQVPNARNDQARVTYYLAHDDLRVRRNRVWSLPLPARQLDEQDAREIFVETAHKLDADGVINLKNYDLDGAQIGYMKIGEGWSNKEVIPRVVEYRFTALRNVNGLETPHDSIRVSVHVAGQVTGVRVLGLEVADSPLEAGAVASSLEELQDRFDTQFPEAVVEWEKDMLVLHDQNSDMLEPMHVVSFSEVHMVDGRASVSRRQHARYSLLNPLAPVDIWPTPEPDAEGDPR